MSGISIHVSRYLTLAFALLLSFSFVAQAEEGEIWTVDVPVANVRAQPVNGAALVTQLAAGEQVTEVARRGSWLQVQLPDQQTAWMHQVTLTQEVIFFGLPLSTAGRSELRAAIKNAGVQVIREVDAYPYDLYDPSSWVRDATEMAVGYTLEEDLFAVSEITFRSFNDPGQVLLIAERLREQLGPWQSTSGQEQEGPVKFIWQRGEITILVHRGWPDTSTYLTYEIPERIQQMQESLEAR